MPLTNRFCTACGVELAHPAPAATAVAVADPPRQRCAAPGCHSSVRRAGHTLCYAHWKAADKDAFAASSASDERLTATALGEKLELGSRQLNHLLAELGWISRAGKGWVPTSHGLALGATQQTFQPSGVPYVLWPATLLGNRVLRASVRALRGDGTPTTSVDSGFRERFPAQHRTADGHMVRSRAELLIDNWLYMSGIVHAYERQLPIEEEVYCDFYLPAGKVFVEYWGLERDSRYAARKQAKQEIYGRHRLQLIELGDDEIRNLDDCLPKLLLRHGISVAS